MVNKIRAKHYEYFDIYFNLQTNAFYVNAQSAWINKIVNYRSINGSCGTRAYILYFIKLKFSSASFALFLYFYNIRQHPPSLGGRNMACAYRMVHVKYHELVSRKLLRMTTKHSSSEVSSRPFIERRCPTNLEITKNCLYRYRLCLLRKGLVSRMWNVLYMSSRRK